MVEQLTLNQLVRGSSPRPATSGFQFPASSLLPKVPDRHVRGMAGPAVAVVHAGGLDPVEAFHGKGLVALRAGPEADLA